MSIHNLIAEPHQQRQETIGKSALWTYTSAIVLSGKVLWRHSWLLRVGAVTRLADRNAEGQWWGRTCGPKGHTLPHPHNDQWPPFSSWYDPSGWRGCVQIHDYTTMLLSCFLAARQNNSCPLRLHTRTGYVPCVINKPLLCCFYRARWPRVIAQPIWWLVDIWDVSQN